MGNAEQEKKFRKTCGNKYTRLCSFFYEREANIVTDLEREIRNATKRTAKGTKGRKTRNRK